MTEMEIALTLIAGTCIAVAPTLALIIAVQTYRIIRRKFR